MNTDPMKPETSEPASEAPVRVQPVVGLRPCPFCGTKRIRIHEWLFGAVIVCECGGRGPEGYGETKIPMACDLWNRREQPNVELSHGRENK